MNHREEGSSQDCAISQKYAKQSHHISKGVGCNLLPKKAFDDYLLLYFWLSYQIWSISGGVRFSIKFSIYCKPLVAWKRRKKKHYKIYYCCITDFDMEWKNMILSLFWCSSCVECAPAYSKVRIGGPPNLKCSCRSEMFIIQ